jgi:hypothetical protein
MPVSGKKLKLQRLKLNFAWDKICCQKYAIKVEESSVGSPKSSLVDIN